MTYMYDLFSNWDVVELTDMDIKLKDRVFFKKKRLLIISEISA